MPWIRGDMTTVWILHRLLYKLLLGLWWIGDGSWKMSNHRTKMVCGSFHSEAACLEEGGSMSIRFVKSHIGVSKLPQWHLLERCIEPFVPGNALIMSTKPWSNRILVSALQTINLSLKSCMVLFLADLIKVCCFLFTACTKLTTPITKECRHDQQFEHLVVGSQEGVISQDLGTRGSSYKDFCTNWCHGNIWSIIVM